LQVGVEGNLIRSRHHGWGVVWLGKTELAGAERRTSCNVTRSKMGTRSERRRNVAKGFAARWTELSADDVGAKPTAPLFALWVDTLNGGARH